MKHDQLFGHANGKAVEDAREQNLPVFGLGTVRVRRCEHPLAPHHFQAFSDNCVRAICPLCHVETLRIEIDAKELDQQYA